MAAPTRDHQVPETFQTTEMPGMSPRPNHYPPRTGRLITKVHVQHWSPGFILHNILKTKHRLIMILKPNWWIMLVRLNKTRLPLSIGVDSFAEKLLCGYADTPSCWSDREVRPESSSSTDTHNHLHTLLSYPGNT